MDANTMKLRLEQWMPIFEAQARSGMDKTKWCDENGIRRWEFFKRQRECREYMFKISGSESNPQAPALSQPEFYELPSTAVSGSQPETHNSQTYAGEHICVECGKFRFQFAEEKVMAIEEELNLCGFFCILTSEAKTAYDKAVDELQVLFETEPEGSDPCRKSSRTSAAMALYLIHK